MVGLRAAVLFLTRLPIPSGRGDMLTELRHAPAWFPVVGVLIGGLLALLDLALRGVLAPTVASALLLIAGALLTGGLHLDGWADTATGLWHGGPPSARLDAMRQSVTSRAGALALTAVLAVQYLALSGLPEGLRTPGLLLAPAIGRWAIVLTYATFPYARVTAGASWALQRGAGRGALALSTLAVLGLTLTALPPSGLLLLLGAGGVALGLGRLARSLLGGITGDVCGAAAVSAETVVFVALPAVAWLTVGPPS